MSTEKKSGVIYILTNPSFPDYVKIGYATNIEKRLAQINRSECMPFAFRVYATYEVSKPLQDKELHSLIDRLNPDLRAIDTFNGKTYSLSALAQGILETSYPLQGPVFWTYQGKKLRDIRREREKQGLYR